MNYNINPELQYSSCTIVDGYMYFYATNIQALVRWKLGEKFCEFLCEINVDNQSIENIDIMLEDKTSIYMLDVSGNYLFCYNIERLSLSTLKLSCHKRRYDNYAGAFIIDGKMMVVTKEFCKIIIIDLFDLSIKENIEVGIDCVSDCVRYENTLFIVGCTGEQKIYSKGILSDGFDKKLFIAAGGQVFNSTQYCFVDKESRLRVIDLVTGMDIIRFPNNIVDIDMAYIFQINGKYILFPSISEDIMIVDGGRITRFDDYPDDFGYVSRDAYKYWDYAEDEDRYYLAQQAANYLVTIDKKDGGIFFVKMILNPSQLLELSKTRGHVSCETRYLTLACYIKEIVKNEE